MKKLYFLIFLFSVSLSVFAQINSVAIVGEAAGGWPGEPGNPGPTDVHQMTSTNGTDWTLNGIVLTTAQPNGGIKFRANNAWDINWGSPSFPSGTATLGGQNIVCQAGTYNVTFNSNSGAYNFTLVGGSYPTIAIVGTATAGGWPNDPQTDPEQLTTSNGVTYRTNFVTLTANELKFRQNNSWATSWGGASFPSGPQAGQESANIVVTTPGKYRVVFNRTNGQYTFDFPAISIVGEAVGGWPGDPGNPGPTDVHQLTTTDGDVYTINNLNVTTATTGGGAKFRQDNSWTVNWGSNNFPTASSSNQGGENIPTVAGTYNVTFTRSTGGYNFTNVLSVTNHSAAVIKVYPNPTTNLWTIDSGVEVLKSIQLFDVSGKLILSTTSNEVDGVNLSKGIYFAKIQTENITRTVKLIKQ